MTVSRAAAAAEVVAAAVAGDRPVAGTLRMWGQWFGRPYDNVHRVVGVDVRDDLLALTFDADETLLVEDPGGVICEHGSLAILEASRVRWQWYLYGRDPVAENLAVIEHVRVGPLLRCSQTWPQRRRWSAWATGAAVELLGPGGGP